MLSAAALTPGLPLVILPLIADRPTNAGQVAVAEVGVVVTRPEEFGAAVQTVLADPMCRVSVWQIAWMNRSEQVLNMLIGHMAQPE